jgi:hypothetical protein
MKTLRKLLAAGMSLLLMISTLLLPMQALADDGTAGYTVLAEFPYTAFGSGVEKGPGTGNYYAAQAYDLTEYATAAVEKSAPITAPDVYLQMDINATYSSTIGTTFLQPHSGSSLVNVAPSPKEKAAMGQMAGKWYTVSAPLDYSKFGGGNDGIDLADLQYMTYFVPSASSIQVQNLRIVKITNEELRTALTAEVNEVLPKGEDGYISLADYLTAKADAQTLLDNANAASTDLMTAWNVLRCVKDQLEPLPEGVYKGALEAALAETLPENAEYDRVLVAAWETAKEAGQTVYENIASTQQQVDDALQAITDARALIFDITYMVAEFSPAAAESGIYTWNIKASSDGKGVFNVTDKFASDVAVDSSRHDSSKLRFRVDMRLSSGDVSKLTFLSFQLQNSEGISNNTADQYRMQLTGEEWLTIDCVLPANWTKTASVQLYLYNTADPVVLEVKNMRIVDITLDDTKAALQELIDKPVGDASLYTAELWQTYQAALAAAKTAVAEATTNTVVWAARDALQEVLDEMGNRGVLMAAIEEELPENKTYSAASVAAWEAAKAAGLDILQSETATDEEITAAIEEIAAAKAALVETTYLVAEFPPLAGSDDNGVYTWEISGNAQYPTSQLKEAVDLSMHDPAKLRFQVDMRMVEGDVTKLGGSMFLQPKTISGKIVGTSIYDIKSTLKDGAWHTFSINISQSPEDWYLINQATFFLYNEAGNAVKLEVKNMRIVDLSTEPTLNSLFADDMMFQQNKPISVFGQGGVGTTVAVTLTKDNTGETVGEETVAVGEDGCWQVDLPALKGSYDTYTLTVEGEKTSYTYSNILIGEVWAAGGQSNMEYAIQNDVNNTSILEQTDEYIRIFFEPSLVYNNNFDQPLTPDFSVRNAVWVDATNTDRLRGASSVAYNFALVLREKLGVPVGFLNTPLGGTCIEAWISREGIESDETVKTYLQERGRYYDENNWPQLFNRMSALYNQKIGALAGYHVAGTIWYQGETNLGGSDISIYTHMLNLLQKDWGRTFGYEGADMPFIFAHIAPHTYTSGGYSQATSMAYFWEAMSDAWADNSDTMAQVPIYDLPLTHWFTNLNGEAQSNGPIHPADKIPVGQRMAAAALGLVYDGKEAGTAPVYKSMEIVNGKIRVTFDQVGSGLQIKDGNATLHGFAIAGEDGVYVDAYARIVSADTVEVWNDRVPDPKNVTYAFNSFNMAANLQNAAGIAAAPFRSTRNTVDGNLYLPRDWQYADGETWVVTGSTDSTKWENLWQSDEATLSYNSQVKAEGTASLKADYSAGFAGIGPVKGKNSVNTDYSNFNYVSIRIKNPDDREKTLRLQFTFGNTVYTAALADLDDGVNPQTCITLAPNSDFTTYAFDLSKLVDPRGTMANEATVPNILRSSIQMEWVITDEAAGTVYLDDVQFGREALVSIEVDTSVLEDTVAEAEAIDRSLYTQDTVAVLERALQAAKTVLNNANATQNDVDAALGDLEETLYGLKLIENEVVLGDVDDSGNVEAVDALLVLQAATGKITLNDTETWAANVDGQGNVTANDALLILQYATKKIDTFPSKGEEPPVDTDPTPNPDPNEEIGQGSVAQDKLP